VGLLYGGKATDAIKPLETALRERERQLTRVPSEIYPAAMLDGLAELRANKFDAAAVAYSAALKQRPSDAAALKLRDEALVRAGKPEAAGR
jgi:cytochrome c-type biogenesis protein CcmH/NrfG